MLNVMDIYSQHPNKEAVAAFMETRQVEHDALQYLSDAIDQAREMLENGQPIGVAQATAYADTHQAWLAARRDRHRAFHVILGTSPDGHDDMIDEDIRLFFDQIGQSRGPDISDLLMTGDTSEETDPNEVRP